MVYSEPYLEVIKAADGSHKMTKSLRPCGARGGGREPGPRYGRQLCHVNLQSIHVGRHPWPRTAIVNAPVCLRPQNLKVGLVPHDTPPEWLSGNVGVRERVNAAHRHLRTVGAARAPRSRAAVIRTGQSCPCHSRE